MSPWLKLLLGLAAVSLMAWIHHGPFGAGEALVSGLENKARAAVAETRLPGITVSFERDPLTRVATLSGEADDLQRQGMGSLPGLNDIVGGIEGVAGVRWSDEQSGPRAVPLFLESLGMVLLAYLLGLGVAWLIWGRERPEGFY